MKEKPDKYSAGVTMEENRFGLFVLFCVLIPLFVLIRLWLWFGSRWSPGEDFKDEIVRQYGASRAWLLLFILMLVGTVVWLLMTSGWEP